MRQGTANLKKAIELKNSVQLAMKKYDGLRIPNFETPKPVVATEENLPGTSKSKHSEHERGLTDLNESEKKKRRIEMLKVCFGHQALVILQ